MSIYIYNTNIGHISYICSTYLARRLDKVPLDVGAGEPGRLCPRAEHVHHVAELVEVGLHLVVVEQRRLVLGRLREVGHHGADADHPLSLLKGMHFFLSKSETLPQVTFLNGDMHDGCRGKMAA